MGLGGTSEHIGKSFDLVMFKIILGSFGAFAIFPKYEYYNASSSTLRGLFEANFVYMFRVTVDTKVTSGSFEVKI